MSIKSDLNILKGFNNKDPFEIINENYYEENRKNMQGQRNKRINRTRK